MSGRPQRPTEDPEQIGALTSDRSLRLLCQTALEAFVVVDDARRYVHVNESAAKLFGASADELVGHRIGDFTPPELLPALERIWADFERNGYAAASHGCVNTRDYDAMSDLFDAVEEGTRVVVY